MSPLRELTRLLGGDVVSTDPQVCGAHAADRWFASRIPEAVILARSTADVSTALGWATKHRIPITPRGAGYGYVGGCVPVRGGVVLSLERMNRIKEISAVDFVAVVQPAVLT